MARIKSEYHTGSGVFNSGPAGLLIALPHRGNAIFARPKTDAPRGWQPRGASTSENQVT
jgi:hypothetical protein